MENQNLADDDINIDLHYSFVSSLGIMDGDRYFTDYKIDVVIVDDSDKPIETIGKVQLTVVLIALAMNNGFDLYQIFDNDEAAFQIGQKIFDFEQGELNSDITESLKMLPENYDIGILREIEILPAHRAKGLGKRVMKDIIYRLQNSCGLLLIEPFPIQFANEDRLQDEWSLKMIGSL